MCENDTRLLPNTKPTRTVYKQFIHSDDREIFFCFEECYNVYERAIYSALGGNLRQVHKDLKNEYTCNTCTCIVFLV